MVFDKIAATPGLTDDLEALTKAGELEIVSTHVQDDELRRISNLVKRGAVLRIPRRIVPTTEVVLGVSRFGLARFGSGEAGGVRYDDIQIGNPRHIEDALIGLAAAHEADVLVTDEDRLAKKVKVAATTLQVWNFARLVGHIEKVKKQRAGP